MTKLKVINLWSGPGAGKSTAAAGLFSLMKNSGYRVELVTEVAKDLTYARHQQAIDNKLLVFALQDDRLRRLQGKVDWVITDSPTPLGIAYMSEEFDDWLPDAIWDAYDQFDNINVWIKRTKPYAAYGRNQTEAQALALDLTVRDLFLDASDQPGSAFCEVTGDAEAPYAIMDHLGLAYPGPKHARLE